MSGRNALRETVTLEVVSLPFGRKRVYALRVIATLKVVSQHLMMIPCETTFTEHERNAYTR
ncbi:hypothetical protein [Collibacillus ludicampi]|uniref:hypothetical protein n=1 Tax=Collibacillus ludicampi TaxID=2771369 RepID=UPI00249572A1|nr:hypothetical protein [Collibacillus ludicampi]